MSELATGSQLGDRRICVIGLGLMGGSLLRSLHGQVAELRGVDPQAGARDLALKAGWARVTAPSPSPEILADIDLVILAAPVCENIKLLATLDEAAAAGTHIIDLSSTKATIMAAMAGLRPDLQPVGGHPMCGKEVGGISHADPALYRGQVFVLCPLLRTSSPALEGAKEMVKALGSRPVVMGAAEHDHGVARVSHLPYLLAAALIMTSRDLPKDALSLAAGGFRDTSRVSASDATMVRDVLLTNRGEILAALDEAQGALGELGRQIESADPEKLLHLLRSVQRAKEDLPA